MDFDYRKLFSKVIRTLLLGKSIPLLAIASIFLLGVVIILAIVRDPPFAIIIVATLTLILVCYLTYIAWLSYKESIRLSDIVEIPNYNYRTICSELSWIIENKDGTKAILKKRKIIKALELLEIIKEYTWGDSEPPKTDDFNVGEFKVLGINRQGGRYIVEIGLDRRYKPGEELEINYQKNVFNGFCSSSEWVETTVTTNTDELILGVIFPIDRPYISAKAVQRHGDFSIFTQLGTDGFHHNVLNDGRKEISWSIIKPIQRDTYTIEWDW